MKNDSGAYHQLSAEEISLLKRRATQLAAVEEGVSAIHLDQERKENKYLCFRLRGERYGLPLAAVREVIPLRNLVLVPGAPVHVVGLMILRGKALAIADLGRFWHGSVAGHSDSDLAVILDHDGQEVGLVCNEIEGLIHVSAEEFGAIPPNLPPRIAACVRGMTRREIMIIQPSTLLGQEGFVVDQDSQRE